MNCHNRARMTADFMYVSFSDHAELLRLFLDRRQDIVEGIESRLLNVRDKAISRSRDRHDFRRLLDSCFFTLQGLPVKLSSLKGQLADAHLADGFEPIRLDAVYP